MTVFLLKMVCPVVMFISVFYPLYRGLREVCWWKSILLGWVFFVSGCLVRDYVAPAIAMAIGGEVMKGQIQCANTITVWGIALGWIIPLVFHGLGVFAVRKSRKLRTLFPES